MRTPPPRREWVPVLGFALLITALTLIPYAACERRAQRRPGWQFTGITSRYFRDTAYHLSWVRQARDGFFLFENKYAGADAGGPRFFNLLFLTMGWAGRAAGADVITVFHAQRLITAVLVLMGVYWFAGRFYTDRRQRWLAMILAGTSGGLYWLLEILPQGLHEYVGEPKLVEVNTFRVLEWEVVAGVASGLMVLALGLSDRALRQPRRRVWLAPGLAVLAIAAVHPHDVVTLGLVLAAMMGVCAVTAVPGTRAAGFRRDVKCLVLIFVPSLPLLAYHAYVLFTDPSYRAYAAHEHHFYTKGWLSDYGLVLVAAVVGAVAVIRKRERNRAMLVVFPAVIALLLWSPWPPIQRAHFHHGLHIVLCVLAVRGLWWIGGGIRRRAGSAIPAILLGLFVIAASLANANHLRVALWPEQPRHPWYIRDDEAAAIAFLDEHARPDDVIACVPEVGAAIPYMTGSRVFAGHPEAGPEFGAHAFFAETLMRAPNATLLQPPFRRHALAIHAQLAQGINYIYIESEARRQGATGGGAFLERHGLATRVFSSQWTVVYEIDSDRVAAAIREAAASRPGGP